VLVGSPLVLADLVSIAVGLGIILHGRWDHHRTAWVPAGPRLSCQFQTKRAANFQSHAAAAD